MVFQQFAHARHGAVEPEFHAHVQDQTDLVIDHRCGQTERGNIAAHQSARRAEAFEDHDFVAERREVIRERQRRRTRADASNALAVALERPAQNTPCELTFQICSDTFQSANGDRLFLDASAPAGRLARPIAHAPQDARKHV